MSNSLTKKNIYNVFIIEDDFRVANINKQFVEKISGFQVAGIANTGKETLEYLEETSVLPDIILLDVYIPDVVGLELMWKIRKQYAGIEIIMVTAAKEADTIKQTMLGGIFDYIIKPVDFNRLSQTFERYVEKQKLLDRKQEITQEELDAIRGIKASPEEREGGDEKLPKGIDPLTLEKVVVVLEESRNNGCTAVQVGQHIGTSRSTARRYLEYLVVTNRAKTELIYGEVGRPERRYIKT
ncbi:response regulator [Thalassobacillus sp. C254]|uniref:response regulator transcription factor n=1 Tax=Thalassobacillus sp. C254 TaxID=1225341 RepID=UPI0006D2A73C|nr:response regulator [Thalassobacillus sp. C254]